MPGSKVAGDFHLTEKRVQIVNIFPWTWKETAVADGLGEYYSLSLWSQPMHTFFAALASINIPFEVQEKIFGLIIILLGFWGIWKLLDKFNINTLGKSIGSIFFLLNSYFLLIFDGGQLSLALAYCILPIVVYYFLKATETDFIKDKLKFVLWVLILSIADIRIVYLVLLIILIFSLFKTFIGLKESLIFFRRLFLNGIFVAIVLAVFHMYWLMPTLISKQIQLPQTYERLSQISFLSFSTLAHSFLFQQPHWYKNIFGSLNAPRTEFIFIPLTVFSVLVLIKKNANVAFWLLIAIISIFLSKGSNEPLSQVYSFLFSHIPGFSLFRDPVKFYFLIGISYSVLIAFSIDSLSKLNFKYSFLNRLVKVAPLIFLVYLVWLVRPVYLGQMSGLFSFPSFQKEYDQLSNILGNDKDFARVFWIPTVAPLGFVSSSHPQVEAARFAQKRPFAAGVKGDYEIFNFLREAPYMGEIFDVAGIGYIAYPYLDQRGDDLHPDNIRYYYTFSDQLSKRSWLSKLENSQIPLFKVKNHQDRFFITPNTWWVIGSDSLLNESTKSAQLKLSKNALIFVEEGTGLSNRIDELPESKIVLNNKTLLDLAASFINPANLIFPAKNLDFEPDESGWWKREAADLINWRSFLQAKYDIDNQDFDLGGGWAVGEGNLRLKISSEKLGLGKLLLARVMESSKSGSLSFSQGDKLIGSINTKNQTQWANVKWFEVGELLSEDQQITISSEGEINIVNALAIVDKDEWLKFYKIAQGYQDRITNFDERNIKKFNATVTYQQINPTRYKVRIEGLKEPAFLVFSQNFDRLWKLEKNAALPVYSLLNGFSVSGDGDYIVEFEAQKYVNTGLVVTLVTIVILMLSLFSLKRSSAIKL